MLERAFQRLGSYYILTMMVSSRVVGSVGGGLVIYYVNLTTTLSPEVRRQLEIWGSVFVSLAVLVTLILAALETRALRSVLFRMEHGLPVDPRQAEQAGREAVLFPGRHHKFETVFVPLFSSVPLCAYMWIVVGVSRHVVTQIFIGSLMGIATVLMITFFASERWMVPVIRYLLDRGVAIRFEELPTGRIVWRMTICFGLTIAVTAFMIGGLAYQRVTDIVLYPEQRQEIEANLAEHTLLISLTAVATGLLLSRLLASSVATRAQHLVEAMKRVQAGSFAQRVRPVSNDEIDILARQFNTMVQQLDQNNQTIRELNVGLEHKVKLRTRQLSKSKRSLQRSLKKLREYDQLKTTFFSNISHELRTPLTMIISPVDRIIETHGPDIPARVGSLLEVVRVNANRLLELINQLLEFSKLEAGQARLSPTAVDLNALSRDLVTAAQPLAEQRGIQLRTKLDTRLPPIAADMEKIETVVRNLLSNALKFTPSGGVVEIETLLCEDRVQMAVTDTGIGISRENYAKVFERFMQIDGSASRQYTGTGLGLALVKEFIELHGGEIHLDSEIGLGSRFWFTLPLAAPAQASAPPPPPKARPAKAHRFAELMSIEQDKPREAAAAVPENAPRVLIADDTPEMRALIAEILSDHYHVATACDGAEGWEAVERSAPDLILSDVMMPHVDGYEFCRRVKENPATASIPFVMLTAKADLTMKIEGLNRGADDYLVKPFSPEELRARVASLLRLHSLHVELEGRNGELQKTLAELRTTQTQLIQSEKMSSLGQLVAGIAHEINNAINAVYNGIQPLHARARRLESLVNKAIASPPETELTADLRQEVEASFRKISGLADVIENGASRTARIVRDLRMFSHPGTEAAELFDLNQALEMCLNLLASQMKGRVSALTDFGDLGEIRAPSGQLNQVFMNSLNNAQQAIEGTGEIRIATRRRQNRAVVTIADTGSGIPEEIRSRIFDPFFTTKAPGIGTGLGLSLSYGIVAKLGGSIECHSEVGVGTEFVITFPCEFASDPAEAAVATNAVAAGAGSAAGRPTA
jgi:signal transduction histidine kinase